MFAAHDFTKFDYTGVIVYTRLYSLYEDRVAAWRKSNEPNGDLTKPSPDAEAAVALRCLRISKNLWEFLIIPRDV